MDVNQKVGLMVISQSGEKSENGYSKDQLWDRKAAVGIIRKGSENKTRSFMLQLYKCLAHTHLDYCGWFLFPHFQKDIAEMEKIQRRKL